MPKKHDPKKKRGEKKERKGQPCLKEREREKKKKG